MVPPHFASQLSEYIQIAITNFHKTACLIHKQEKSSCHSPGSWKPRIMALELECLMRTLCWFIDVPFKLDPKIGKRLTNSLRTNSILCEIYANHVPKAPPSNAIITLGVRCQHKQLYGGQEHWGHCNKEWQRMQRLPQGHEATQVAQSGFKFKPSCLIALEQEKKDEF